MKYEIDNAYIHKEKLVELTQEFDDECFVKVVIISEYSCITPTQPKLILIILIVLQTIRLSQDFFVDRLIVGSDYPRYTPPAIKLAHRE